MSGVVIVLLCQHVWTDGAGWTPPDDGVINWMMDSVVEIRLVTTPRKGDAGGRCFGSWWRKSDGGKRNADSGLVQSPVSSDLLFEGRAQTSRFSLKVKRRPGRFQKHRKEKKTQVRQFKGNNANKLSLKKSGDTSMLVGLWNRKWTLCRSFTEMFR